MGQATTRGSYQARKEAAQTENAEVVICLSAAENKISAAFIPRDAEPNQESLALILAGYISANLNTLTLEAVVAYRAHLAEQEAGAADPKIVTEVKPRFKLLGPDGETIQ